MDLRSGFSHAVAVLESGDVYTWGRMQGTEVKTDGRVPVYHDQLYPRKVNTLGPPTARLTKAVDSNPEKHVNTDGAHAEERRGGDACVNILPHACSTAQQKVVVVAPQDTAVGRAGRTPEQTESFFWEGGVFSVFFFFSGRMQTLSPETQARRVLPARTRPVLW